jgi:hypothetical protein
MVLTDKKIYREHASQVGKIMTNPRGKSTGDTARQKLSATARTRVEEAYLRREFNIRKEIKNKYVDKGNECEDDSILLFSKVSGVFGLYKNEKFFKNDYFVGYPDLITDDTVIDIKTSWSGSTYPWFDTELPNKDYMYQLLAYMDLTGLKKGLVAYCLTDTPEVMIQDEVRREMYRNKMIDASDEELVELENQVRALHNFDGVPDKLRVKMFEVEYNAEIIDAMKERVKLCEEYYNEIDLVINQIINK